MIRTWLHLSVLQLPVLAIGACAELQWQKPGTTRADLDRELEQCQRDARLQASHEILP